jgi:hypothetical protein
VATERKEISISSELYYKLDHLRTLRTPVPKTVDEFVEDFLEKLCNTAFDQKRTENHQFTTEEDRIVKDRLKRLGYL